MIPMIPGTKVYLACHPVSMRLGFDGLAARVAQVLDGDPFSGHLFLFRAKRADYLKVLYYDGTGLVPVCQAPRERQVCLAADRGWQDGSDAGAAHTAHRGDGLAADGCCGSTTKTCGRWLRKMLA